MERDLVSIRRSLTVMAVISVFVVTYFARDLILPMMLGFLLALTLSPINRAFQKAGLPAILSAAVLVLMATATILVLAIFVGDVAQSWSDDAPRIARELQFKLSGVKETVDAVRDASKQVEELAQADGEATARTVAIQQPTLLSTAALRFRSRASPRVRCCTPGVVASPMSPFGSRVAPDCAGHHLRQHEAAEH